MSGFLERYIRRHQPRQLDDHFGAARGAVRRADVAVKILHDAVADGQAQPQPFSLCAGYLSPGANEQSREGSSQRPMLRAVKRIRTAHL